MTRKSSLCAVAAFAAAALFAVVSAPDGLSVEYRTDPCGLDAAKPRFGWRMGPVPAVSNAMQGAYRVLVASSRELLGNDDGDLWDSGKVVGDRNVCVEYAGKPFQSSQQVFWKVKTWDANGVESAWSAPAQWTTGIMKPGDWKAKWIGSAASMRPDEDFGAAQWITAPTNDKGVVTLECEFDFDGVKDGEYVDFVHAAVTKHEIDVNGKAFHRWEGAANDWRYPRFRDMTRWLVKGKNKIVVRVFAAKPREGWQQVDPIRFRASKDARAFLAKITFPDGRKTVTGVDGWKSPQGGVSALGGVRAPEWGRHMILRTETASPAFAKSFEVRKPVASAVLHVTGVGFYEARLNGAKIGRKVLDPSPTVVGERVLYSTYRLDKDLRIGGNELRLLVGHGWYDMRAVAVWNFETAPWRDFPRCIAQLEITYADGTREVVATDKTWRQVKSEIAHDDIFEGEVLGDVKQRGVDLEKSVVMAEEVPAPCRMLESEAQPGAEITREVKAKGIHPCGDGAYVVDFGENFAGWVRIVFRNQRKGDIVSVRYDERVNEATMTPAAPSVRDGISAAPTNMVRRSIDQHFRYTASHRACAKDAAFQTDRFVCSGAKAEVYEPRFVYHGFRYLVLNGVRGTPTAEDFTACMVQTAFESAGTFECSDPVFGKLMDMADKAYRGNFTDGIPTDCPHREKNGWTGDASIACELAQYLYENTAGYEKWLRDIVHSQLPNGNIPSIVPSSGWGVYSLNPAWDSALPVIAWNLWTYRGDRRILDEVYPALVKYLGFAATKVNAQGLIRDGLGDWVPVDEKHMPAAEFTSSCCYHQALTIAANIAEIKGLADAAADFRAKAAKVRLSINKKYYKGGGIYEKGYQTAQTFPLAYGIVEDGERAKVEAKLVEAIDAAGGKMDFGILGAKQMFRVLSRMGRTDLAFRVLVNPAAPSFADWAGRGESTLWESWRGRASRNHIMFGDYAGWAYQYLAGIRHLEAEGSTSAVTVAAKPAFGEIVLAPQPIKELDWLRAAVKGPNGEIVSSWRRTKAGVEYVFIVPPNTRAHIMLPREKTKVVGSGQHRFVSTDL